MDNKLDTYFGTTAEVIPHHLTEQKIQSILESRRKRRLLVAVSIAALLWMILFSMLIIWVQREVSVKVSYGMGAALCLGMISSAIFSGLVLKFKKVGV